MRRFLTKLLIFTAIPTFLVLRTAYDIVNEPIDKEGFRAWENLSVLEKNEVLTGPFYPGMSLHRTEYGDQAKPAGFEVPKDVIWETDKYGFRKKQTSKEDADIVVIGDSFIAGSTLTQTDMLTEKLQNLTGRSAYPYAPSHIKAFISDQRFISYPPKVVILAMAEKLFQDVPEIDADLKPTTPSIFSLDFIRLNGGIQKTAIVYDRLKKKYFFDLMRVKVYEFLENFRVVLLSSLKRNDSSSSKPLVQETTPLRVESDPGFTMATDRSMVFSVQADDYFVFLDDKKIDFHVWKMKGYRDYLKNRGIRFIVAVIPNKENIYYKILKGNKGKPDFINRFNLKAKQEGLEVADIQTVFNKSYNASPKDLLFQVDDSHWNRLGVQLAAGEIAKIILGKTSPLN